MGVKNILSGRKIRKAFILLPHARSSKCTNLIIWLTCKPEIVAVFGISHKREDMWYELLHAGVKTLKIDFCRPAIDDGLAESVRLKTMQRTECCRLCEPSIHATMERVVRVSRLSRRATCVQVNTRMLKLPRWVYRPWLVAVRT